MIDDRLAAWANEVSQAEAELESALKSLEMDKKARSASFWARLVGFACNTPAKRGVAVAQAKRSATRERAQASATQWAKDEARRNLEQNAQASQERARLGGLIGSLQARKTHVALLHGAASQAVSALNQAASQCRSASTADTIDAFSSNKGMSVWAYSANSSAREAVSRAKDAVANLARSLPEEDVRAINVNAPDGTLAFAVDQLGGFGFLDLLNASKMSSAANQCEKEARLLNPLLSRLSAMLDDATAAVGEQESKLRALEQGFLDETYAQVPDILRGKAPEGLA